MISAADIIRWGVDRGRHEHNYLVFRGFGVEHSEQHLAVAVALGAVRGEDVAQTRSIWRLRRNGTVSG